MVPDRCLLDFQCPADPVDGHLHLDAVGVDALSQEAQQEIDIQVRRVGEAVGNRRFLLREVEVAHMLGGESVRGPPFVAEGCHKPSRHPLACAQTVADVVGRVAKG